MAHHKGMGSTKNGRDSESKRLGEQMVSSLRLETFCTSRTEPEFIQV